MARVISRIAMSAIFVLGGVGKIASFEETLGFTAATFKTMGLDAHLAPLGDVPTIVRVCLAIAVALELIGGLALALGFEQLGALLIITFLVAVTPIMHWPIKNGQLDLHGDFTMMMKNICIIGALMYVYTNHGSKASKKGAKKD